MQIFSRKRIIVQVVRRSAILFLLGLVINSGGHNDFRTLRVPGVLQRFAICFLISGSLEAWFMPRETPVESSNWMRHFQDLKTSVLQVA